MNLVADECCDALLVNGLRSDGHDVLYVKEMAPGTDDETVLQTAADQQRLLLTEDKDFGELVVRLQLPAYSIVLLRMNPADSGAKLARLRHLLLHHAQRLPGSLVVLDAKKIRFRPLPLVEAETSSSTHPPARRPSAGAMPVGRISNPSHFGPVRSLLGGETSPAACLAPRRSGPPDRRGARLTTARLVPSGPSAGPR